MSNLDNSHYSTIKGFAAEATSRMAYEILRKYFWGKSCLELGCADGGVTRLLLKDFKQVAAVEGSGKMVRKLMALIQSSKLTIIHSKFEDLELNSKFDTIFASHVLEHVSDPVIVLKKIKRLAHDKTRILISVPNALSLHRQAGVLLGMIPSEYSLNEADISIGHQRVYDLPLLKKDIERAGLRTLKTGGFFLKPFSNSQMEKIFGGSKKTLSVYSLLGEKYPTLAAEIYAVCRKI